MAIETYEQNLNQRLVELRRGDPAYKRHTQAIWDAIIYTTWLKGQANPRRILDSGCGLGFLSKALTRLGDKVVGIDPSEKAIAVATKEHQGVEFFASSAETFPSVMKERGIKPFDIAVLNMVLHSVDDKTCINILNGTRDCLQPTGTIILIVPTKEWFEQKLIEYAQDTGMNREDGIRWVADKINKPKIEVPMKIRGGEYYPQPLTVFPRTEDTYGRMLDESGYGYLWNGYDAETRQLVESTKLTHLDMLDYTSSQILYEHDRAIYVSFYFPKEYWRAWKKQYGYTESRRS